MKNNGKFENPLGCPVVETLALISGKWKPMVIHVLASEPQRFGALKRLLTPISQKVLTEQLRELEADGLVSRQCSGDRVLEVTYSLSDYGRTLTPVLDALYEWGSAHREPALESSTGH